MQNWKWSNKTFPHTLYVVSTSDETTCTQCGICGRKQTNSSKPIYMIAKYHPSSLKILSVFLKGPLMAPVHCHLQGGGGECLTRQKIEMFEHLQSDFDQN